jgi:hypothetical protein
MQCEAWGGAGRWRKLTAGALLCFVWKEEEAVGVGRVGRKAEQACGAARPTRSETEEKFISK